MKLATMKPLAGVVFLTILAAGCDRNQPGPAQTTGASPPAATTQEARGDIEIGTAVRAKYYGDEKIRGEQIDVAAENGVVTLRGTVPSDEMKQHAVTLARSVEGVTSVNDQLEVGETTAARTEPREPEPGAAGTTGTTADARQPWWITTKIQAQYFTDADVKPWNVDVTTSSEGVVTLEGTVDSAAAKSEAVRIARETEGVARVEDRLKVEAGAPRAGEERPAGEATGIAQPDPWLTAKIQAKYFVDDEVKARNIDVDTQNGVVTLQGVVANESERRQALAIARNTEGVREVKDNLRVDRAAAAGEGTAAAPDRGPAAADRKGAEPADPAKIDRPDPWITTKIQAKYFLDADVKGHQIDVDTKNGVVTLQGRVENAQQKQEAEQIARETEGVKRVNNQLTVGTAGA